MDIKDHPYSLFQVTGVELEYMIVDRNTLSVRPECDTLLKEVTGKISSSYENGDIAWSNELVNHVVELKTNGPVLSLIGVGDQFYKNIQIINSILSDYNAMLLPTGAHPWMNPFTETQLWKHDYNRIYELYNRIFDCRGHGWSNLQSTHINLPFSGDEEFGRLHAAIRIVLPLIPALCASTPVLDGEITGFSDSRLEKYRHNQKKISSIAGKVIPEAVFTEQDYYAKIFHPIIRDIKPYDDEGVLEHHFLNSRGAIARFDRGAIEIRIIDIQECPKADLSIVEMLVTLLQWLVTEATVSYSDQKKWHEDSLAKILIATILDAENAEVTHSEYLKIFGMKNSSASAGEIWQYLVEILKPSLRKSTYDVMKRIIHSGTLSSRIVKALEGDTSPKNMKKDYDHSMKYELPVIPSPSLPNYTSVRLYMSLCLFEGTDINVGRGTDWPFQVIGYPDPVFGDFKYTPGVRPGMVAHVEQQGEECYGIDLRDVNAQEEKFTLKYLIDFYEKADFKDSFFSRASFFDKLAGTDQLREQIIAGKTEHEIRESWAKELEDYKTMRKKYLLYKDFE